MIKRFLRYMTAFLPAMALAGYAYAGTQTEAATPAKKEPPPATLNVSFEQIEGLGLYTKSSEGSLGKDLWQHSKRSEILFLLENMPAASETSEIGAMIMSVLLTNADPKLLQNDVPPEPGKDLLTLRLEKLLEAGAYKQAFELYSLLDKEAYHERLAHAGVLAMLYDGEKSLACLETNIMVKRFQDVDFWKTLSAYCTVSLSEDGPQDAGAALKAASPNQILEKLATDKNYRFQYTDAAYGRLSVLERALLAAEDRLDIGSPDIKTLQEVPATDIQPLLRLENLSGQQKTVLTIRSVQLGLSAPETLQSLYYKKDFNPGPKPSENWAQLSYFYNAARAAQAPEAKWSAVRQALPLMDAFGVTALLPYATPIQNSAPKDTTLDEILTVYQILNQAGINIPENWIKVYEDIQFEEKDALKHAKIDTVLAIIQPENKKIKENLEKIYTAAHTENPRKLLFLYQILDALGPESIKNSTQDYIYDKDFYLTMSSDYVMQSGVVWDRLVSASSSKAIGETVLLNIVLLHAQKLQDIYPGLLGDILKSTEHVGLSGISRTLAVKASLGSI